MEVKEFIRSIDTTQVSEERKAVLKPLIEYILEKKTALEEVHLNFICTHNSRRSQFAQVWSQVAASICGVEGVFTYSGGVEVTALNERVAKSLESIGMDVNVLEEGVNPVYKIQEWGASVTGFSKMYDDPANPKENFAAIMVCDHADENCPFIPGAERRIPIRYIDPKRADDTAGEETVYMETSKEIATEMFYVFQNI